VEHARLAPASRGNVLRQLLAAARYRAPPMAPPVPLLLLASERDRLVAVACSRALAEAWQVPFAVHPCAGHDLALDDPAWLIEQVLAWRNALPRPP
jgi:pimeloyl-ACP methyl ester carboxylesterase